MPLPRSLSSKNEPLILVDARNRRIGEAGKRVVHERGLRHRAFSIFLVDAQGRVLLQQRALTKYHSGGLWANSCCGHPRPGERTTRAAQRRLGEELGAISPLQFGFRTHYRAEVGNGLTENEIVHVYFGPAPARLNPHPSEVAAVRWVALDELVREVRRTPARYAVWLRHYLDAHQQDIAAGIGQTRPARTDGGGSASHSRPYRDLRCRYASA